MSRFHTLILLPVVLSFYSGIACADDAAANASFQSRMRDTLRATMQQLNDAQTQVATLQASQAQSDKDNADLKAKVDALNAQVKSLADQALIDKATSDKAMSDMKQAHQDLTTEMVDTLSIQINMLNKSGADDKSTLDKSITDMEAKDPTASKALSQYGNDIQLWKTGYYQYVQYGTQTEAARAKLAAQAIMLQRVVDDRETKNLALYDTASEILTRYENFSFGDALSAKEPFVGITRVKLQELVQDYKDKIAADKIKIGQKPSLFAQSRPSSPPITNGPVTKSPVTANP